MAKIGMPKLEADVLLGLGLRAGRGLRCWRVLAILDRGGLSTHDHDRRAGAATADGSTGCRLQVTHRPAERPGRARARTPSCCGRWRAATCRRHPDPDQLATASWRTAAGRSTEFLTPAARHELRLRDAAAVQISPRRGPPGTGMSVVGMPVNASARPGSSAAATWCSASSAAAAWAWSGGPRTG